MTATALTSPTRSRPPRRFWQILSAHIHGCVKDAMHGQPEDAEAKIEEVLEILDRCL